MINILRTDSDNIDFVDLVKLLDADTKVRDGVDHLFHIKHNKIDNINHVLIAYIAEEAVGCGAIKHYRDRTIEIKRMFVHPEARGKGIASRVLAELENWAREMNYEKCILETGKRYPEARGLYAKSGYSKIPNYDQYIGIANSVCFEKTILKH